MAIYCYNLFNMLFVYIHTHIFHVAIWPVLPYVIRYMLTYIGLYKYEFLFGILKPSNVHTNTFHASNRPILQYMTKYPSVADSGGGQDFVVLYFQYMRPAAEAAAHKLFLIPGIWRWCQKSI